MAEGSQRAPSSAADFEKAIAAAGMCLRLGGFSFDLDRGSGRVTAMSGGIGFAGLGKVIDDANALRQLQASTRGVWRVFKSYFKNIKMFKQHENSSFLNYDPTLE